MPVFSLSSSNLNQVKWSKMDPSVKADKDVLVCNDKWWLKYIKEN